MRQETSEISNPAHDDQRRLSILASYGIIDTPAEQEYDDIALLAGQICAAPIALVTVLAPDRLWIKARVGFDGTEAPIDQAICVHGSTSRDLLVIPDMRVDPRTSANPQIVAADPLVFYAGAPLVSPEGAHLGTLCVIDRAARPDGLSASQASALLALARQVMTLLELRRAIRDRDDAIALQHAIITPQEVLIATQRAVSKAGGVLGTILDTVVGGVVEAMPHADGAVFEMIDGDELVYRSAVGALAPHAGLRIPVHGSLSGVCVIEERAIRCADALSDPRINQQVATIIAVRSCIVVPVSRDGAVIGVLLLQSARPDAFTDRDLQLAQIFAGTISAGIAVAGEADARREVRASEERYRAVFESAIDYAIVVMDLGGTIIDWSEGARRILGWEPADVIGHSVEIFFTPEDVETGVAGQEMGAALTVGRGVDERWHMRRDGARFWANGEMMVLRDEAGVAVGFVKILRDRTEQRQAIANLAASETNLRTILATVPVGIMFVDAPSGRIVERNAALDAIVGQDEGWIAYHADGQRVATAELPLARLLAEEIEEAKLQVQYERRDGSRVWIDIVGRPIRDADGNKTGAVIAVSDIDARKKAEAMQSLMNHELSHRMKNLLAMVQAIAMQSMRGATDIAKVRDVLSNRLVVLGQAHDLLLGGVGDRAQLAAVVRGGIGVHDSGQDDGGRVRCSGMPVEIGARPALALAMMIHELSTNATKYGALSVSGGSVLIDWWLDGAAPDQRLVFEWREQGGPTVAIPKKKGFGSRLIERSLSGLKDATVVLDFAAAGVVCRIEAPLAELQEDA